MANGPGWFNRRWMFKLVIGAGLVLIALLSWNGHQIWFGRALARQPLPLAQGEAAIELLKQRGEYASLQQAMETARYRANAEPQRAGEFAALNPAHELHARFTPQGVEVRRRSDEQTPKLAMTLRGIGYGERQLPVSPGTVTAQDQRIEIHRNLGSESAIRNPQSAIVEWYINRPTGLEQGFTISQSPGERPAGERLRLTLELSGEWRAKLSADGQAVEFRDASGGSAVRYDHLAVRDAQGKTLPARMSLKQSELRLEVEDAGAAWPVTIDPTISQQAYLKASNTEALDAFGHSVAVSGDTVVVGAPYESSNATGVNGNQTDNSAGGSGAVYVFTRSGGVWTQQAYLKASNTDAIDQFGWSVAVSGDTVVVGALAETSNATGVNGNQMDNSTFQAGAAYVFTRSAGVWSQQAYLKASNTGASDQFGWSVAVSGDTVVIGARNESSNATGINGNQTDNSAMSSGAAYVFIRSGVTWTQQAYLKASNTGSVDYFGYSVAVSGDTVVVGAFLEDSNATGINGDQNDFSFDSGAAYVFTRSAGVWTQQAYLKASSNTGFRKFFGWSVAVSEDTVVIGAPYEDSNATGVNGNPADNSATNSGAAYVFTRSAGVWTQQAYLKASNAGVNDAFGWSVAVSGDTVAVATPFESSNATGINGNQMDNSAANSGAAYLFTRSGVTWTQQAYLKASNTDADDRFGESVAVSGDTVVVGAIQESSNATGINGNQADNSASNSGAVYVFANTPPGITAQADVSRQQGSPSANSTIATVSDAETAAGSLTVTVTSANPSNGVALSNLVNTNGTITADIVANCEATNASFTLQVSDGSLTTTAPLNVMVTANTAPALVYGNASVNVGASTTNSTATATDNGSITGYSVQSQGTYTGTVSVNASGVVSISNAGPVGAHTITIRATDNCGSMTDAAFTLQVINSAPTISAAAALPRQRGSAGLVSTIATVGDAETPVDSLVVMATTVPAGITVTSLTSAAGTVTANVAADCTATIGINVVVLTVTDANGGAATASLWINVTDNTAPAVTYADASANAGAATSNSPTVASDNGSITGYAIQSQGTYTGTISVSASGVVSISNASPPGNHVITVRATDNCNATTDAQFTLNVACPATVVTNGDDSGAGSLRQIIADACVGSTITFQAGVTTVTLTSAELLINKNLTVDGGSGVTVTRSTAGGTPNFRIFRVQSATVAMNNLTVSNGNHPDQAGGLYNDGTLTLTACAISGNTSPQGGGIQSDGILTMADCTVSNNIASDFAGGLKIFGPTTTLTNCTFSNNQSAHDSSAVETHTGVTLTLINCTIANNQAGTGAGQTGGALFANGGTTLKNTVITNNTGNNANVAGTVDTANSFNNLIGTSGTGGLTNGVNGNVVGVANANSLLAPLGNYGGPTLTIALLPGSPAINAGTATGAPTSDQRGITRVGNTDIGAYESQGFALTLSGGNNQSAFVNTGFANPLAVSVTANAAIEPVNGGRVTFTPPGSGASATIAGNPAAISGGTASVNATANGTVGGPYTVAATANGAAPTGNFSLTNTNPPPTITSAAALSRQQGTAAANSTIATVSDPNQTAGTLTVTATNVPSGLTVTNIVNTNGTITANVAADCTATPGANTVVLTVTDANNGTATANLTVNVTANSAPSLSYPVSGVALNAATTINPTTASDNGSITGYQIVSVTPPLTVAPTVNSSGVVSVTDAGPFGLHTVTVRATDNCGATTEASFTLNVGCGSLTVNPATLINGLTFVPYSSTLSASGGSGSYTFTLVSGTLPAGLSLGGDTISGTPNTAGASTFTIRATDDNGCIGERSYTLLIGSTGLMYYPLARPVRLLDTRPGASANACFQPNAPIPGGTVRTQPARGTCEGLTIPPSATTITGNITTVQSGGGFLAIYPSDAPPPLVANSNYLPSEIVNNSFTVGVGAADGAVNISVTTDTDVVVDVTGYYAPPTTGGLYFHPLPRPVRLLETRQGFTGCFAPATPLPGGVNTTQQGTGSCQGLTIPAEALALVGNATTVNPSALGYLTLYPADAAQPLVASSNYGAGQTVNGPFTVGLSPSGQFKIFPQWTTDLVIDITGYYSAQANDANGQGLLYSSLGSPLRLLDTRAGLQGCYTPGAAMVGGTVYTQETQSPCTNLTPTARALIGNATVVNTADIGYLTFWPGDAAQPLVATSNYVAGQVINRYFTVGLGPDGSFKRFANRTTDLVVDISGFFAP